MALSRGSLHDVIEKEQLYQRLIARLPMEDVLERMRRDVTFQCLDAAGLCAIRFVYEDATHVQRATRDLLDKMSVPGLAVMNAPVLPKHPEHPTRLEVTGLGLVGGFFLAWLAAGLWRSSRIRLSTAATLVGGILAAAISFALPKTYVSIGRLAVSSLSPLDRTAAWNFWMPVSQTALGTASLARIATNPSLSIAANTKKSMPELLEELRKRIDIKAECSDEFSIAFRYGDPAKAQLINAQLITSLVEESFKLQHEPAAISRQPSTGSALALHSGPTIREEQGQLRTGIEGIDVGNMPGKTNPQDSSMSLLLRGFPSGTPTRPQGSFGKQTADPPIQSLRKLEPEKAPDLPRLQVIAPANLPEVPVSPNSLAITLAGIVAGLAVGVMASIRIRIPAGNELRG
jgi:hypothetical protein